MQLTSIGGFGAGASAEWEGAALSIEIAAVVATRQACRKYRNGCNRNSRHGEKCFLLALLRDYSPA